MECYLGWGWLPLGVVILMSCSILITYTIAVLNGDVSAFFPYISDAGAQLPESSIFAQFLNIAAFVAIFTLLFRYWVIMDEIGVTDITAHRLARVAVVLGVLAAFGLSLVGNFQDDKIPIVHFAGAFLVFVFGGIYCFMDTAITYRMSGSSKYKAHCRLAISILGVLSLVITGVAGYYSSFLSENTSEDASDRQHWARQDLGFKAHLVSTFGEWFMALAFILYFVSFIGDFRTLEVDFSLRSVRQRSVLPGSLYSSRSNSQSAPPPDTTSNTRNATEKTHLVS